MESVNSILTNQIRYRPPAVTAKFSSLPSRYMTTSPARSRAGSARPHDRDLSALNRSGLDISEYELTPRGRSQYRSVSARYLDSPKKKTIEPQVCFTNSSEYAKHREKASALGFDAQSRYMVEAEKINQHKDSHILHSPQSKRRPSIPRNTSPHSSSLIAALQEKDSSSTSVRGASAPFRWTKSRITTFDDFKDTSPKLALPEEKRPNTAVSQVAQYIHSATPTQVSMRSLAMKGTKRTSSPFRIGTVSSSAMHLTPRKQSEEAHVLKVVERMLSSKMATPPRVASLSRRVEKPTSPAVRGGGEKIGAAKSKKYPELQMSPEPQKTLKMSVDSGFTGIMVNDLQSMESMHNSPNLRVPPRNPSEEILRTTPPPCLQRNTDAVNSLIENAGPCWLRNGETTMSYNPVVRAFTNNAPRWLSDGSTTLSTQQNKLSDFTSLDNSLTEIPRVSRWHAKNSHTSSTVPILSSTEEISLSHEDAAPVNLPVQLSSLRFRDQKSTSVPKQAPFDAQPTFSPVVEERIVSSTSASPEPQPGSPSAYSRYFTANTSLPKPVENHEPEWMKKVSTWGKKDMTAC